jgi:hypothetical protein
MVLPLLNPGVDPEGGGAVIKAPDEPKAIFGGKMGDPHYTALHEYLKGAFVWAVDRIARRTDCANLFGGWDIAMGTLAATSYRILDLGQPRRTEGDTYAVTGAATMGPVDVFINSSGPFFNQNVYVPETQTFLYLDLGTGLTGFDWASMLLLHELGHQTKVFQPDASDSLLNRSQSKRVLDSCFTSVGSGLYK